MEQAAGFKPSQVGGTSSIEQKLLDRARSREAATRRATALPGVGTEAA
jgi:hypothetical protein